jgi:hypothetical protein
MSNDSRKPFFKIYIIESPAPEDLKKGRSECKLLSEAMRLVGVRSEIKSVSTREDLERALDPSLPILRDDDDVKPFLHISSHGNEKGVLLGSGEQVSWKDLRASLAPINAGLRGYLVLCMSTCYGAQAVELAMTEGDLPVLLLVGIPEKVLWSQALIAFIVFYNVLAKGGTAEEAVQAMNASTRSITFEWHNAQKVQQGYLNSTLRGLID